MAKKRRPLTQQDQNAAGAQAVGSEAIRIIDNLELEGEVNHVAGSYCHLLKPLTDHLGPCTVVQARCQEMQRLADDAATSCATSTPFSS